MSDGPHKKDRVDLLPKRTEGTCQVDIICEAVHLWRNNHAKKIWIGGHDEC